MTKLISNGGEPMNDCPRTWDEAEKALAHITERRSNTLGTEAPVWKWDCGFKLDFDGPLVSVSSRFYPPKEGYGPYWDGDMSVCITGATKTFAFKADSFMDLINAVEEKEKEIRAKLALVLNSL